MEISYCAQCGCEIESKGISFRGRVFCGDECCEAFEAEFEAVGEPGADDLDNGDIVDLADVELDADEIDFDEDGDKDLDDDFAIDPEDF